jgi:FKBP-type peptidyl-prolyl cis-trans isomerase FkpA
MLQRIFSFLIFPIIFVLFFSIISCNPDSKFERQQEDIIQQYLASNPNIVFDKKASGLYYHEIQAGQGKHAVTHDTAFVKYTGKFLDGTVFDSNVGSSDTLVFPVNERFLIRGFDEGITYMNEGGKASFLMPSELAYGNSGYSMPGYTPVLFDVELLKIKPGPGK